MTNRLTLSVLGIALLFAAAFSYLTYIRLADAATGADLQSNVATSSNPAVGTTPVLVFATSTNCGARIITTYASPITLYFSNRSGQQPSGTAGHLQAASTTTTYNSGIYGCGAVYVYSFAAGNLTVTETR